MSETVRGKVVHFFHYVARFMKCWNCPRSETTCGGDKTVNFAIYITRFMKCSNSPMLETFPAGERADNFFHHVSRYMKCRNCAILETVRGGERVVLASFTCSQICQVLELNKEPHKTHRQERAVVSSHATLPDR